MSDCNCLTSNDNHAVYCPEYKYAMFREEIDRLNRRDDEHLKRLIELKEQIKAERAVNVAQMRDRIELQEENAELKAEWMKALRKLKAIDSLAQEQLKRLESIKSNDDRLRELIESGQACAGGMVGCRGGKTCTSDHK